MRTYELPKGLIAQYPVEPRDSARLLVIDRVAGKLSHRIFQDLPELLSPGDCLILNDTQVLPARLYGQKAETGGKVELLLLSREENGDSSSSVPIIYRCLGQPGKRLRPGTKLFFGARHQNGSTFKKKNENGARHHLFGEVVSSEAGEKRIRFYGDDVEKLLRQLGEMPLPPYIDRPVEPADAQHYQTVFARVPGAVAAPTAGLHFTQTLLDRIREKGVGVGFVTLHVGWGTFKPVGKKELQEGQLHAERFSLPRETVELIETTRQKKGRVIAVGTTVVRVLEACADEIASPRQKAGLAMTASEGMTRLFIQPGFQFQAVDGLITNFHLPGTSLLLLVSAFAGEELIQKAYEEAVRQRYRFYSYGDAMLITGGFHD